MDITLGSWDTFVFVELFFNSHMLNAPPPPPHKQRWTRASRIFFSEFHYCVGWQEGELKQNFEKDELFNKGTQSLQKIVITALLSQGL